MNKDLRGALIAGLMSVPLWAGAQPPAPTFHVSPQGDDAAGGSAERPFRTLVRARDAARTAGSPARIVLADGLYTADAPLAFTAEDRHLEIVAAKGASPVVSAGRRITGWTVDAKGHWHAAVPKGLRFSQFYVNGQRRQRPFLPRTGYYFVRDGVEKEFRKDREAAYLSPQDWPKGENPEMEFCMFTNWKMLRARILSYEASANRVTLDVPPMKNDFDEPSDKRWYRLDNVRSALGEPGDWYLDTAAGELTYVPCVGEKPAGCEAVAACHPHAVTVTGSEDIVFRGIVFAHGADWARAFGEFKFPQAAAFKTGTVQVEAARGIRFEDCAFLHTGATGLVLRRGSKDCAAERCEFSDLGAGGVRIGDGYDYRESDGLTSGCTVRNCLIEKGGRFEPAGVGVLICHARGSRIADNTIEDLYYSGISLGWGWSFKQTACENVIENNDIDRVGQKVLSDLGGIYTLSRQAGTVIRGNRVRNVTRARYGAFGIYHDSGSSEIVVSNNLVSGCTDCSWFVAAVSDSNRAENNLFCDAARRQLCIATSGRGSRPSRLAGNVVKWTTEGFSPLPGPASLESENNAYICDEAGLPSPRNVRGFVRCRDLEEAKDRIGFRPFPLDGWGWKRPRRFTANMPAVPAVFFPAPAPRGDAAFLEDFSKCRAGDPWPRFTNSCEGKPEMIRVVEDPSASGGKCVEFTQSLHAWRPHVYRSVSRTEGRPRISFRIRLEKGASTSFEVRDGEYHAEIPGPYVALVGGGKLRGRGGALMDLPADVWIKVGLEFEVGEEVSDHTYSIRVRLPGDEKPRVFSGIPISPRFTSVGWIGFMSDVHGGTKFRIDDFRFGP